MEEITKDMVDMAFVMRCRGFTWNEIAKVLQINVQRLLVWYKYNNDFRALMDVAHEVQVESVERALFRLAVGYEIKETKSYVINQKIVDHEIVKRVAPDIKAIELYLTNRAPERWAAIKDGIVNVQAQVGVNVDRDQILTAVLAARSEHLNSRGGKPSEIAEASQNANLEVYEVLPTPDTNPVLDTTPSPLTPSSINPVPDTNPSSPPSSSLASSANPPPLASSPITNPVPETEVVPDTNPPVGCSLHPKAVGSQRPQTFEKDILKFDESKYLSYDASSRKRVDTGELPNVQRDNSLARWKKNRDSEEAERERLRVQLASKVNEQGYIVRKSGKYTLEERIEAIMNKRKRLKVAGSYQKRPPRKVFKGWGRLCG